MGAALDPSLLLSDVSRRWDNDIVAQLTDYIGIPAKSPSFDAEWAARGLLDTVLQRAADWVLAQKVPGLTLEIVRLPGRTPVLFFEVAATRSAAEGGDATILMYGHMDKQPEFNGWRNDLGPWTPKYEDGRLYGRGGADDGYAIYASIAAIQALKAQGQAHARIVGVIETSEESGSPDLPPYIDAQRARLGRVELVIGLDSGAGNYDQLWLTTSLRGMASGTLRVEILTEGIHSGDASGLVPSSFRIMRQLLDRLEDSQTGRLLPASFHCEIPAERLEQARATAQILGEQVYRRFPWVQHDCDGDNRIALPTTTDPQEALLRRTWTPTLSVTGAEGFPALRDAGNVVRPYTALKLSLPLPPLLVVTGIGQHQPLRCIDNVGVDAVGGVLLAGDKGGKHKAGAAAVKVNVHQLVDLVEINHGADLAAGRQTPDCGGLGALHRGRIKCVQRVGNGNLFGPQAVQPLIPVQPLIFVQVVHTVCTSIPDR